MTLTDLSALFSGISAVVAVVSLLLVWRQITESRMQTLQQIHSAIEQTYKQQLAEQRYEIYKRLRKLYHYYGVMDKLAPGMKHPTIDPFELHDEIVTLLVRPNGMSDEEAAPILKIATLTPGAIDKKKQHEIFVQSLKLGRLLRPTLLEQYAHLHD